MLSCKYYNNENLWIECEKPADRLSVGPIIAASKHYDASRGSLKIRHP